VSRAVVAVAGHERASNEARRLSNDAIRPARRRIIRMYALACTSRPRAIRPCTRGSNSALALYQGTTAVAVLKGGDGSGPPIGVCLLSGGRWEKADPAVWAGSDPTQTLKRAGLTAYGQTKHDSGHCRPAGLGPTETFASARLNDRILAGRSLSACGRAVGGSGLRFAPAFDRGCV
jgi:hypothetical protein